MKQIQAWIVLITVMFTVMGCKNYNDLKLTDAQRIEMSVSTPEKIEKAQQLFDSGKYKSTAKVLSKWIKKNAYEHPYMDDALFLKGNACYNSERYYDALQTFEILLDKFGASEHYSEAMYKEVEIATRFLEGEKRRVFYIFKFSAVGDASEILTRIAARWPGSKLAVKALTIEADYYFDNNDYKEAQESYQLIVNSYSTTDKYQHALFRNAESTFLQYRAPIYESTPLTESRFRYTQYLLKFPVDVNSDTAQRRLIEIENLLAEKEYSIASFYAKTNKNEAAQYYYEQIIKQWPQSIWAQHSAEKLSLAK